MPVFFVSFDFLYCTTPRFIVKVGLHSFCRMIKPCQDTSFFQGSGMGGERGSRLGAGESNWKATHSWSQCCFIPALPKLWREVTSGPFLGISWLTSLPQTRVGGRYNFYCKVAILPHLLISLHLAGRKSRVPQCHFLFPNLSVTPLNLLSCSCSLVS